uniref:RING-type E3 ubiquitin transferase n=1 Tax=Oncorhynchus mykiss TaxID=8022 RepID=A0A8K9WMH2_ONCMY
RLTIYFHAVLSKDFKLNPDEDRIFIRAGGNIGNWKTNSVELTVDLGEHGFLVEGSLITSKSNATVSIPYKYLVYKLKKQKYEYEYIYKLDSNYPTTNRCLFVKSHLLNEEGDWHQYDDIICVEPSKNVLKRLKDALWPEQRKSVIEGREIAGKVMLESIFDLLRSWTDINFKSFLNQLNQFYQIYGNPFVYEETHKKWYSLDYDEKDVSEIVNVPPALELSPSTYPKLRIPLHLPVLPKDPLLHPGLDESPLDQIEIYCSKIEVLNESHPHVAKTIEKCALEAVTSLCQVSRLVTLDLNTDSIYSTMVLIVFMLYPSVAVQFEGLEARLQTNIEAMTLDQFMEVHPFDQLSSPTAGVVTFFELEDDVREMAEVLHRFKDSYIFKLCWEKQARDLARRDAYDEDYDPEESVDYFVGPVEIHSDIFLPCYAKYDKIYKCLKNGSLRLEEVDTLFKAYRGKYEELAQDLDIMCRNDKSDNKQWIQRRVHQIEQYHELHLAVESAQVIMLVKQTLNLQGNFQVLQTLLEVTHEDFKREHLDRIDNDLMQTKLVLVDITEPRRLCLQELGLRKNFVIWVKEALEGTRDINELKVFVDLASISAGENDLDVDRVACFHDAVLGYSPMLYELKPDSGFQAFKEVLKKLWRALDNDNNLPKKLRDTARHLEWLKTVKDSHGSVELSSLSLASAINSKGIYIISAQNQKKLNLDTALKLQIPEEHDEGHEMRRYSLEDLRELQNKLMLMSGKGDQGQCEVDQFAEVFASVQRLAVAFIALFTAGNPLFRHWEANINCSSLSQDAGIIMDFNLGSVVSVIMVEGSIVEQLPELCRKMEKCLKYWNDFMDKQRSNNYYLNYYTAEQIVYLCCKLTQQNVSNLEDQVLMMLSFVKPNCTASDLRQTCLVEHISGSGNIERLMPKGLAIGSPNLIVSPHDEILTSCISIYMSSKHEPLPTYDEVLLCNSSMPYEQVELFLRRCLTAGYRGEKIYTMLYGDQLSYEVSSKVESFFQRIKMQSRKDYRLVIICSSDREHAYLPSAFSQYRLHMVPQEPLSSIQRYLNKHYTVPSDQSSAAAVFKDRMFVGVVSSSRAGVGKSLYIKRLYEKLKHSTKKPSLLKCIRLIEPRVDENVILQSLLNTPKSKELIIFHFDVTSSVRKGLYEFLFKLLVLGYLMDSEGRMWKCSNKQLYVIEILQEKEHSHFRSSHFIYIQNARANSTFLDVFPNVFCRPPKEVLDLEMRMREDPSFVKLEDPFMDDKEFRSEAYQRPYQYLTRFHNQIDLDTFMYNGVEGTYVECLQMLFMFCGIMDPSWAELRNFAWFLNLQLRDCETSVFCDASFTGDTLQGFKNFVVDFMILMAKDFATPSLSISDQSPGRQQMDLTGVSDEDLAPFRIRKRWESEPHPYIFFNDDHVSMTFIGFHLQPNEQNSVDAIDPSTRRVIKRDIMTRELYEGLKLQRVPFNIDFDQLPRGEKIERLCNVLGIQWPLDPDETYELTTDNILKMLAIHMRFRCGIPVIIMGETGCGKTRLIKFLCELRRSGVATENMKLVKVHGGTSSDMIYTKIREAEAIAFTNKQDYSFDSVLFFDEANTTEAISSIKEVLCDNTVEGECLVPHCGLQIIAACNPYRKHTDEMIQRLESAGLGYRVRAEETDEKLGSIPLRQLVYRVQALPPSMIPLVWDFGQLNDHTEKMYIQQIVQRVVETNTIDIVYTRLIADVLSASQRYMRTRKDECSFVSLRDVERCMQAFVWFYKNHAMLLAELNQYQRNQNAERSERNQREPEARDPVLWSVVMALGICYHACLENKDKYRQRICKYLTETYTPFKVMQEISLMQDLLLSGVPLGETIARNNALKENVFMMVVCIELRIPLFLVGKPGSSKSLSKTLVADAMQGQAAHSDLYKRLKQIHLVSFQCSPHSTPEGIINTFKQCGRFQEGKNLNEYISVVVLDEIGLAEDSPKMPLKTLHPLLEEGCIDDEPLPHKKVGFIGISNWALDPAKMNRGIFVSRCDPDEKELIESAKGICSSDTMILEKVRDFFQPFARAYLNICRKQGKGFFGLRDYYSLIKMVFAVTKASEQRPSAEKIVEAVLRNFSGRDDVDAVTVFTQRLQKIQINLNLESISTINLVRQNISAIGQEDECRYLLVLTKNYAALQILQQTFFSESCQPEIIFGSSFPKDQEYTQICRNINRVKICMETGRTVVLLNLQNLYESLYDALNQYYVCLGGQKYVDLGLGTHRVKCRVHKDFRLIVIEEKEVVYKQFPIPLINRLEKHYLDIHTVLKEEQRAVVVELEKWVGQFVALNNQHTMAPQTYKYLPPDVFIGYHSDTCASVVLQMTEKQRGETDISDPQRRVLDEAKLILLNCATPDSVVRLDCTVLPRVESEHLARIYFEDQKHSSLADFIFSHTQQDEQCHSSFTEVTTFSRLLTASDVGPLEEVVNNVELLSLQQFDTEHSFLKKIRENTSGNKILIIQSDFDEASHSANLIASAKYSAINEINKSRQVEMGGKVFVYFITKLPRMEGGTSYVGFHGDPWRSVHIDDLRRSKDIVSDIKALRNLTISQLFEEKKDEPEAMEVDDMYTETEQQELEHEDQTSWGSVVDTTALVRSCVQSAVGMLRDQLEGGVRSTRRVEILLTLLTDNQQIRAEFLRTVKRRLHSLLSTHDDNTLKLSSNNWVIKEASNIDALQEGGTFRHTLWKRVQTVVIPFLAQLVSVIDRDRNLDILLDSNSGEAVKKLWLDIFGNDKLLEVPYTKLDRNSESKTILVQNYIGLDKNIGCIMPFSWRIRDYLDELWVHFVCVCLLCGALTCCVNELRLRHDDVIGKEVTSLPWVHAAYHEFKNRLQNLSRMISMEPQLAQVLRGNTHAREGDELVLDVYAAVACVEYLEPQTLDTDGQRLVWLRQVKRLQVPIELVCSEENLRHYKDRSMAMVHRVQTGWNRVVTLSLFVEHMLLGIEAVEKKLNPLVLEHTRGLCQVSVVWGHIYRNNDPCPVCMSDPHDPLSLPCDHIYCLACIRQWLVPGQMFCPLCMQAVPDDFALRVLINQSARFRKQCNAFFIDLVSTVCFKDNSPPCRAIILHLLSFLMVEVHSVPIIRGGEWILTKALSPFDDSVDKNPVVRSVVLKLLLKYSFDDVKDYLQQHLTAVEQSNILEESDKNELYSLYINCLEVVLLSINRMCSCDASLSHYGPIGSQEESPNGVAAFLTSVVELCRRSGNDWYRVYLIRKICSQRGVEFVQKLLKVADIRWLFPAEVLQQVMVNEDGSQIDQYLVCGEDYKTIRDAVAKAMMEGKIEGLDNACEGCKCPPQKKAVYLLLALFREVTSLYRSANDSFHPKPVQCQALLAFIQASKVLVSPEVRAFAQALVANRLGPLEVRPGASGAQCVVVELSIHLAAVLLCGNQGVLLTLMFVPDMLAVAHKLFFCSYTVCPNNHPCTIGECGQPMERSRCLDCGLEIGGDNHIAVPGFQAVQIQGDRTQTGHILGEPRRRDNLDMQDTKNMSPVPFNLLRLVTHMAMLLGASSHPQVIGAIIKPPVPDPGAFLWAHLLKDMEQVTRSLGKGSDDTVNTVHLVISSLLGPHQPGQWPVPYDNLLSTKEARNGWETTVSNDIITPQLKHLDRRLKEVNAFVRADLRVSSNPVMRLVFGDPRLFLASLPRESLIHSSSVWSCRERVSLLSLTHIVEQHNGRDTLPMLWRFLQREAELRLVKFLPDILALQRDLVKRFQNVTDLTCHTIADFLHTSLTAWYEKRVKIFLTTWNQLRVSLATNGEIKIPGEFCREDLDLTSDFLVLLPRRQGPGLCSTALVSYLIALHNELVYCVDKHTGEETSYSVSPADLSDLHVIRYEPERDLLPLVLSNCQYSVERGQEALHEYDLPKIQQQILARFLQGKPLITLNGIPTLVNRHDRNYENILKDVKGKVQQEPLPILTLSALAGELQSYSEVCEALSTVEVALGFLAMTGGEPQLQLERYLEEVLQMGDQTGPHILKALSRCSLKHCVALWQLLTSLKSENMLRLKRDPFVGVSEEYRNPLGDEDRRLLTTFFTKSSADSFLLEMHEFLLLVLKSPRYPPFALMTGLHTLGVLSTIYIWNAFPTVLKEFPHMLSTCWLLFLQSNQILLVTYTWLAVVNASVAKCLCF